MLFTRSELLGRIPGEVDGSTQLAIAVYIATLRDSGTFDSGFRKAIAVEDASRLVGRGWTSNFAFECRCANYGGTTEAYDTLRRTFD